MPLHQNDNTFLAHVKLNYCTAIDVRIISQINDTPNIVHFDNFYNSQINFGEI